MDMPHEQDSFPRKALLGWSLFLVVCLTVLDIPKLGTPPVLSGDSLDYLIPIHNLVAGLGYISFGEPHIIAPPLLGMVAYLFHVLGAPFLWSGIVAGFVGYLALPVVILLLAPRVMGKTAALTAALVLPLHPQLINYSTLPLSEPWAVLCLTLQFLALLRTWPSDASWREHALLGISTGLGYLNRPELLLTGAGALGLVFIKHAMTSYQCRRISPMFAPLTGILILFVIMAPYVVFLSQTMGSFSLTGKGRTTLITIEQRHSRTSPEINSLNKGKSLIDYLETISSDRLNKRLEVGFWRERHYMFDGSIAMVVCTLLLGAYFFAIRPRFRAPSTSPPTPSGLSVALMTLWFLTPLAVYPFFLVVDRYIIPYVAVFKLALCFALGRLVLQAPPQLRHVSWSVPLLALFCTLAMDARAIHAAIYPPTWIPYHDFVKAGAWLAQHKTTLPLDRICVPHRPNQLMFLAHEMKFDSPKSVEVNWNVDPDGLPTSLQQSGCQVVVLTKSTLHYIKPLKPIFLNPTQYQHLGLELIHLAPEHEFVIFRWTPPSQ